MLVLNDFTVIQNPNQIKDLPIETRNNLYSLLNRGLVLFIFPDDFKVMNISSSHRFTYKIGFLYDVLSEIYSDMGKTQKYEIISEYYHFFFTYRRFKDKLDEYNASKKKYLINRNLL